MVSQHQQRGHITAGGALTSRVDFGTGPLSPAPGANAFLLQLAR